MNFYNDIEPFTCDWLQALIQAGELSNGHVERRSICDVQASELSGFTQCHWFCGIGGWPYALQLAGWPANEPVWSASLPCQPFSSAGKRRGTDDERHLWPEMFRLVRECRPPVVFGEQVAAGPALGWLDGVFADLEGAGYSCWAAIVGAFSVGAPHIRQRLFWVADADEQGRCRRGIQRPGQGTCEGDGAALKRPAGLRTTRGLGDADGSREGAIRSVRGGTGTDGTGSPWSGAIAIPCRDGKHRRISAQPGDVPLAYGLPRSLGPAFAGLGTVGVRAARRNRVGRLKGYGNAIVPQLAAEFIRAFMEAGQ